MQTATMPEKIRVIWGNDPETANLKSGDEIAPGTVVLRIEDCPLDLRHGLFEAMSCKAS